MRYSKALVTGATSGVGEAICHLLAEKGIQLIITGRNEQRLEALRKTLAAKVPVVSKRCDLCDVGQRKVLVEILAEEKPDLVINNAGAGMYGSVVEHDIEEHMALVALNVAAVTELTIESVRIMQHEGGGTVMNISSVAAFFPFPYFSVYAATKAYVNSFSEAVDVEVASSGVRVLAACPGRVATHFGMRASKGFKKEKSSPSFFVMDVEYAAVQVWKQIEKGKTVRIFDWKYRMAWLLSYIVPRSLLYKNLTTTMKDLY
jgi:uncharacterized protein